MASRTLRGSDAVMDKIKEIAQRMGSGHVKVGFMAGATYEDGTPVASVAFWNEFGHGGKFPAPPRPFFRNMIASESGTWPEKMAKLAKATNYNGSEVLALMGEDIKGALQQSLNDFSTPELSPTTLRLRALFGNNPEDIKVTDVLQAQQDVKNKENLASGTQAHPLIWTGHMLNSITYKVQEK